jgi:hypothetical protein
MIRQRLRGFLGTTIAACIPWTALGLFAGLVFQFDLIPGVHGALGRPIPGGFVTLGLFAGVVIGLVNGLTFSSLVLATERGKQVEDLHPWRFAIWGAIATAGTLGLLIQSPLAAAIGGVVGAGGGLAALWTARRARVTYEHAPSVIA